MTESLKAVVALRALLARINRKLAGVGQRLKKSGGTRDWSVLGDWFILDTDRNVIVRGHVDPEELARELEVLAPFEVVEVEDDSPAPAGPLTNTPAAKKPSHKRKGLKSKPGRKTSPKGGKGKGGGGGGGG